MQQGQRIIYFFLFLPLLFSSFRTFATEDKVVKSLPESFDLAAFRENDGVLAPPSPIFSSTERISFLPQFPKVNIITGEYCEEEVDLIVSGAEPLSLRRFYSHQGEKGQAYGHWTINPETLVLFNFASNYHPKFAGIGNEEGGLTVCDRGEAEGYGFDAIKNRNFTNIGYGELTGRTHPLNTHFTLKQKKPGKHEFSWEGLITDGSGRKRSYSSEIGLWEPGNNIGPVSQAWIQEDRKPNGNVIRYTYENFNHFVRSHSRYKPLNTFYILRSISAHSAAGVFLGSINLNYADHFRGKKDEKRRYIARIDISGSDGRIATYHNEIRRVQKEKKPRKLGVEKGHKRPEIMDVVLGKVDSPSKSSQSYFYHHEDSDHYFEKVFMYQAKQSDERNFRTTYDYGTKKVIAQSVGPDNNLLTIARYVYGTDHTIVTDAEDNKTIYRFNAEKRITAVEKYQNEVLYSVERNSWQNETGNLLNKGTEDGAGKIYRLTEFVYDKNHNAIEEKIGDGEEQQTVYRTFSDDGFNLKLSESDREGKLVRYRYVPNTNLLSSELMYENDQLRKRVYHFYDPEINSVCVKTIIDDGKSDNPYDLTDITYRKIVEISPKRSLPCIGLPEEVAEKTVDAQGNEILLKKVRYTYHPSGKVLCADHFDARGEYRYSISNEYDDRERLVANIDAQGNRVTREYDANDNLKALSGPRPDMRKEWVYDQINRPIEEREWQTDGTVLIKKTQYDKLSRPVIITDECGNSTHYAYDALGRVTATTYPDGTKELKEYDILGNVTQETDAKGYQTQSSYNYQNKPTKIVYPDGIEEKYTYDNLGRVLTHTDKNGATTFLVYDIFDNPVETSIYASEGQILKTTQATFSSFNKLSETDTEGVTTYFSYDLAGRKIGERTEERQYSYEYDILGRLHKTQKGQVLYFEEHDLLGRVVEKRTVDVDGTLYRKENYAYDSAGNQTHLITCRGTTETGYDSQGNPMWKKDPLGNITKIEYAYEDSLTVTTTDPKGIEILQLHDCMGREKEQIIKNPKNQIIHRELKTYDCCGNQICAQEKIYHGTTYSHTLTNQWTYGPMNRVLKLIESDLKKTSYSYDSKGRLQAITKPDGIQINHGYDDLGRLTRYSSTDIDYSYTYDRKDRVLSVYDEISKTTTSRNYDIYDNVTLEVLATDISFTNKYDPYGRRIQQTLPDDTSIYYTYRGDDLHQVTYSDNICTYSERDLDGNPLRIMLPASLGEVIIQRDKLSRWKEYSAPGYQVHFPDNAYDSVGNLCHYNFADSLGEESAEYTYDDLNQLLTENNHSYAYDSLHNRLQKDQNAYTVNTLCQVTDDGEKSYIYDPNGNLLSDGECTYAYDSLDRLIFLTQGDSKQIFTYDPFHRRIIKKEEGNKALPELSYYLWDGENEIGLSFLGRSTQELRILGEGLGAEIGATVLLKLEDKSYVPVHDHRGSLVTLLDTETKEVVETYRYTAFGEQLTEGTLSPWRFSSKRVDPETGFVYFGRRYYAPHLGRWITPDPQGFEDGPNLYAYLHNSPMNDFDLYGLWSMREFFSDAKNLMYGTLESSTYHYLNMASSFGVKDFSSTNTWQPRSLLQNQDLALSARGLDKAEQSALPFTFEGRRLDENTPRCDVMRSRGRVLGEQAFILGGLFSARNLGKGIMEAGKELLQSRRLQGLQRLSREYLFSGRVKTPEKAGIPRNKNWLKPDTLAEGEHSVFRRNSVTKKVAHYETFQPQTNPYDPKQWKSVKRFDLTGRAHTNKNLNRKILTPHVHDPYYPGGIRRALPWEIPN